MKRIGKLVHIDCHQLSGGINLLPEDIKLYVCNCVYFEHILTSSNGFQTLRTFISVIFIFIQ